MSTTPNLFTPQNNNESEDPTLINNLFEVLNIDFNSFGDNVPGKPYMNRFKKAFCELVYNNYTNTDYIIIDGLNTTERHFFYKNVSELGLKFTKYDYNRDYTPRTKVITVHFPRETHIPNHATYNGINRYTNIKPQIITYCNFVKDSLDTNLSSQLNIRSTHIPATIEQHLTYNAISFYCMYLPPLIIRGPPISREPSISHEPSISRVPSISRMPSLSRAPSIVRSRTINDNSSNNQHNSKIRLELSDIIFDIKDKITDIEFINIMQKLSQIKVS